VIKKIEAIIRPEALMPLQQALVAAGVPGMSASEVRGLGRQGSQVHLHSGPGLRLDFLRKVRVEIVLDDHQEPEVLRLIEAVNRTGRIGDGKVFTGSMETALRIRTAERGLLAI
jgi:nitrogen regulatory protein P-II 1